MTSITRSPSIRNALEAEVASTNAEQQATVPCPEVPQSRLQVIGRDTKRRRVNNAAVQINLGGLDKRTPKHINNKFSLGSPEAKAMASSSEQPHVVLQAQAKTDALIHRLEVSHDGSRLGATGLLAILADASKAAQEGQISEAMHVKVIRSVTESVGLHCSAQPEIANVLANLLKTIDDSPRGAQFPSAQALAARGLIDLLPKLTASTQVDILAQLRTVGNRSFSDVGHGAFFDELRPIAAALPDQEKSQVYASMLRQLPDMPEAHRVHIFKSIMESVDHMSSESRANVYAEAAPALEHIRSDLKPLGFADILAETQKLELCDQAKPLTHLINSITYIDQRDHRSFYLSECLLKINTLPHEARRKPIGAAIEAVLELPGSERKESLNELLSVISDQAPSKAADHMIEMISKLPITIPDAPLSIMLQWILRSSAKLPTTEHANVVLGAINYADGITNTRTMASVVNSALGYVPLLPDQAQKKVGEMYIKHFLSVSGNVALGIKNGREKNAQLEEFSALLTLSEGTPADSPQFATQRNNLRQVMLSQLLEAAAATDYAHKADMYELCKHLLPEDARAALLQKMRIPVPELG